MPGMLAERLADESYEPALERACPPPLSPDEAFLEVTNAEVHLREGLWAGAWWLPIARTGTAGGTSASGTPRTRRSASLAAGTCAISFDGHEILVGIKILPYRYRPVCACCSFRRFHSIFKISTQTAK